MTSAVHSLPLYQSLSTSFLIHMYCSIYCHINVISHITSVRSAGFSTLCYDHYLSAPIYSISHVSITFNAKKSMCMYFSTSINKHCGLPVIYLGNCECQFVNEVKYLGFMIHSSMKTTIDVTRQTKKFYMQANLLLCNFRHCSDDVKCSLFQTRAYLRGGFRGFKPPPKFSDFFLKSEGKEIERKRKKRDVGGGGGGLPLNIFLGLRFFVSGVEIFSGGVEKLSSG